MSETNFAERLDYAMKQTKNSAYAMSKAIGMAQSTISSWRNPVDREFKPKHLVVVAVADYLGVDSDWLEFGNSEFKLAVTPPEAQILTVNEPVEPFANTSGNVYEQLKNGKYKIFVKKVPVKALGSYLSDFQNVEWVEELEEVSFTVDRVGRGNYICFESTGNSMNGGGIDDTPEDAEMLCRELGRQHWKDGFRSSKYGWVIVHKETVLFKDIKSLNNETGDIVCGSRSGLPQHPDFTINLNDVLQIWKVIKRSF